MSMTHEFDQQEAPPANQINLGAPETEDNVPGWMVARDQEIRAVSRDQLLEKDAENVYFPVHVADVNGIKNLQDRNCKLEPNHPAVSETNGIMVYKQRREEHEMRYKAESDKANSFLKKTTDKLAMHQGVHTSEAQVREMPFGDAQDMMAPNDSSFGQMGEALKREFDNLELEQ